MSPERRTFLVAGAALGAGAFVSSISSAGAGPAQVGVMAGSNTQTKSYFFATPLEATWRVFTQPTERKIWWGHPTDELANALEVRPPNFYRTKIDHPGLPGPTEVSVSFDAVDGGTRITHTTTGFGEGLQWETAKQTSSHGLDEMMGDLALCLRTGAGYPRHTVFRCFDFLRGTREVPGGLELYEVPPGTLAAELGMKPGDTLVGIGGAGVYGFAHVHFATRSHRPGDVVEVAWVRGDQVLTGTGKMTATVSLRDGRTIPEPAKS
jgi:hypothetical protein